MDEPTEEPTEADKQIAAAERQEWEDDSQWAEQWTADQVSVEPSAIVVMGGWRVQLGRGPMTN